MASFTWNLNQDGPQSMRGTTPTRKLCPEKTLLPPNIWTGKFCLSSDFQELSHCETDNKHTNTDKGQNIHPKMQSGCEKEVSSLCSQKKWSWKKWAENTYPGVVSVTYLLSVNCFLWPLWYVMLHRLVEIEFALFPEFCGCGHRDAFADTGDAHDSPRFAGNIILQISIAETWKNVFFMKTNIITRSKWEHTRKFKCPPTKWFMSSREKATATPGAPVSFWKVHDKICWVQCPTNTAKSKSSKVFCFLKINKWEISTFTFSTIFTMFEQALFKTSFLWRSRVVGNASGIEKEGGANGRGDSVAMFTGRRGDIGSAHKMGSVNFHDEELFKFADGQTLFLSALPKELDLFVVVGVPAWSWSVQDVLVQKNKPVTKHPAPTAILPVTICRVNSWIRRGLFAKNEAGNDLFVLKARNIFRCRHFKVHQTATMGDNWEQVNTPPP